MRRTAGCEFSAHTGGGATRDRERVRLRGAVCPRLRGRIAQLAPCFAVLQTARPTPAESRAVSSSRAESDDR